MKMSKDKGAYYQSQQGSLDKKATMLAEEILNLELKTHF